MDVNDLRILNCLFLNNGNAIYKTKTAKLSYIIKLKIENCTFNNN